jgi:hypothetical protein
MSSTPPASRGFMVVVGLMLLTTGLAGCMSGSNDQSPQTDARRDCAKRGNGAPRTITSPQLTQDETWGPDPTKRADIAIDLTASPALELNNHTLTIQPCTIVEMVSGGGLTATRPDSTLEILGKEGKEVVIRPANQPGSWGSISLHMTETSGHVIRNATIQNAGTPLAIGSPAGSIRVLELGPRDPVTIDNTTVEDGLNSGIYIGAESGYDQTVDPVGLTFENNTLTNQTHGVELPAILAEHLDAASSYRGNEEADVHVLTSRAMEAKHEWDDLGTPYTIHNPQGRDDPTFAGGLDLRGRLEVGPGTTVAFEKGSQGLTVLGDRGHGSTPGLVALGSVEQRVTFTGADKTPGSWGYIRIVGANTDNAFYNTDFAFGGGLDVGSGGHAEGANLYLDSADYNPGANVQFPGYSVKVFNSQLAFADGEGLHVGEPGSIDLELDHVEFGLNQGHPIAVHPTNLEDLETTFVTGGGSLGGAGELTFLGNKKSTVMVTHGDLPDGELTIPALNAPYEAKFGLTKEGSGVLTLEAGTEIDFRRDEAFRIDRAQSTSGFATLSAQGTASDPIELEGTKATAGHWKGLYFGTGSSANVLEHTQIRHGGSADWTSEICPRSAGVSQAAKPGGNLIVGADCSSQPAGKVLWHSGSSSLHPGTMAGIWANTCDEISAQTTGADQVRYPSFDTADSNPQATDCPPPSN